MCCVERLGVAVISTDIRFVVATSNTATGSTLMSLFSWLYSFEAWWMYAHVLWWCMTDPEGHATGAWRRVVGCRGQRHRLCVTLPSTLPSTVTLTDAHVRCDALQVLPWHWCVHTVHSGCQAICCGQEKHGRARYEA